MKILNSRQELKLAARKRYEQVYSDYIRADKTVSEGKIKSWYPLSLRAKNNISPLIPCKFYLVQAFKGSVQRLWNKANSDLTYQIIETRK